MSSRTRLLLMCQSCYREGARAEGGEIVAGRRECRKGRDRPGNNDNLWKAVVSRMRMMLDELVVAGRIKVGDFRMAGML